MMKPPVLNNTPMQVYTQITKPAELNGDDVWIYVMTEDNKDTLLNEVAAEHGADNVAFRVGVLDTI